MSRASCGSLRAYAFTFQLKSERCVLNKTWDAWVVVACGEELCHQLWRDPMLIYLSSSGKIRQAGQRLPRARHLLWISCTVLPKRGPHAHRTLSTFSLYMSAAWHASASHLHEQRSAQLAAIASPHIFDQIRDQRSGKWSFSLPFVQLQGRCWKECCWKGATSPADIVVAGMKRSMNDPLR